MEAGYKHVTNYIIFSVPYQKISAEITVFAETEKPLLRNYINNYLSVTKCI